MGLGVFGTAVAGLNGQATPGVNEKEVVIGPCAAPEGPSSFLGRETVIGAETYFQMVNEEDGVHGRKLRLVSADDRVHTYG
jgi:ABC-type branched-subunit amino acid transport system substrate-binding protein